jgi:hypothetical protein
VAVVADLFARYLEEEASLKAVTNQLITFQTPSPNGQVRWNQATIRGILTNPVYTGTIYSLTQPSDSGPPAPLAVAADRARQGRTYTNRSARLGGDWPRPLNRESGVL